MEGLEMAAVGGARHRMPVYLAKRLPAHSQLCTLVSILTNIWVTWSGKGSVIRLGRLLVAGPAWIIYTVSAGSIPGTLAELVGMASAAVGLWRYGIKKSEDEI